MICVRMCLDVYLLFDTLQIDVPYTQIKRLSLCSSNILVDI